MSSNRIRIGITGYHLSSFENKAGLVKGLPNQEFSMFSYDFVRSVIKTDAVPVLLPAVSRNELKEQLKQVDALIFAGGEDIHPKYYLDYESSYPDASAARDSYEFALIEAALHENIPILFVCRGMQLLNVYQGGTLYLDLNEEYESMIEHWITSEREKPVHEVEITLDEFTTPAFLNERIQVNSIHHQAIDKLGSNLEVIGSSSDGVIEAVRMKNREDVLAVQWHPEMMTVADDRTSLALFSWLHEKAKSNLNLIRE